MAVPRLLLVVDSSRGDGLETEEEELTSVLTHTEVHHGKCCSYLSAANTLFSELPVVAGAAISVTSFREETLRAYWSFAADTGETFVMPGVAFVLHSL